MMLLLGAVQDYSVFLWDLIPWWRGADPVFRLCWGVLDQASCAMRCQQLCLALFLQSSKNALGLLNVESSDRALCSCSGW